jgi:hypothetical protein
LEHRREILRPIWSNANRDPDFYGNADTHFNCNRDSYAYFDGETFTDAETGANAQAASHAATAPVDR